ncbi:hypothetical protein ScPMuIL_009085 [Solemya velum]
MSHIHQGPLATYNSLTDRNLSGYFSNTRMKRHLKRAGLVNKRGEIITETQYRINMARKEHKRHVKDLLAQAIVHKTLDLERYRQVEIRQKLEEIAKIELVRRVRSQQHRRGDEEVLPYLSPRSSRPTSGPDTPRFLQHRPLSAPSERRPKTKYEYKESVLVDEDGQPLSPRERKDDDVGNEEYGPFRIKPDDLDTKHLYSLDTHALRKYALAMAKIEQGEGGISPYLVSQVPSPPRTARSKSARAQGRRSYRKDKQGAPGNEKRAPVLGSLMLHRQEPAYMYQGEFQTMCEITMIYHGPNLVLPRDQMDPCQEVHIDQQHCGGNTLPVFQEKLQPGSTFTFVSRRHRGFPFSLTIYVSGRVDCRISTCCEYRHALGVRIGGKMGHFSLQQVEGATPCYKCKLTTQASPRSLRRPPVKKVEPETLTEEVYVERQHTEKQDTQEVEKPEGSEVRGQKVEGDYEDDFEDDEAGDKAENDADDYDFDFESEDEAGVDIDHTVKPKKLPPGHANMFHTTLSPITGSNASMASVEEELSSSESSPDAALIEDNISNQQYSVKTSNQKSLEIKPFQAETKGLDPPQFRNKNQTLTNSVLEPRMKTDVDREFEEIVPEVDWDEDDSDDSFNIKNDKKSMPESNLKKIKTKMNLSDNSESLLAKTEPLKNDMSEILFNFENYVAGEDASNFRMTFIDQNLEFNDSFVELSGSDSHGEESSLASNQVKKKPKQKKDDNKNTREKHHKFNQKNNVDTESQFEPLITLPPKHLKSQHKIPSYEAQHRRMPNEEEFENEKESSLLTHSGQNSSNPVSNDETANKGQNTNLQDGNLLDIDNSNCKSKAEVVKLNRSVISRPEHVSFEFSVTEHDKIVDSHGDDNSKNDLEETRAMGLKNSLKENYDYSFQSLKKQNELRLSHEFNGENRKMGKNSIMNDQKKESEDNLAELGNEISEDKLKQVIETDSIKDHKTQTKMEPELDSTLHKVEGSKDKKITNTNVLNHAGSIGNFSKLIKVDVANDQGNLSVGFHSVPVHRTTASDSNCCTVSNARKEVYCEENKEEAVLEIGSYKDHRSQTEIEPESDSTSQKLQESNDKIFEEGQADNSTMHTDVLNDEENIGMFSKLTNVDIACDHQGNLSVVLDSAPISKTTALNRNHSNDTTSNAGNGVSNKVDEEKAVHSAGENATAVGEIDTADEVSDIESELEISLKGTLSTNIKRNFFPVDRNIEGVEKRLEENNDIIVEDQGPFEDEEQKHICSTETGKKLNELKSEEVSLKKDPDFRGTKDLLESEKNGTRTLEKDINGEILNKSLAREEHGFDAVCDEVKDTIRIQVTPMKGETSEEQVNENKRMKVSFVLKENYFENETLCDGKTKEEGSKEEKNHNGTLKQNATDNKVCCDSEEMAFDEKMFNLYTCDENVQNLKPENRETQRTFNRPVDPQDNISENDSDNLDLFIDALEILQENNDVENKKESQQTDNIEMGSLGIYLDNNSNVHTNENEGIKYSFMLKDDDFENGTLCDGKTKEEGSKENNHNGILKQNATDNNVGSDSEEMAFDEKMFNLYTHDENVQNSKPGSIESHGRPADPKNNTSENDSDILDSYIDALDNVHESVGPDIEHENEIRQTDNIEKVSLELYPENNSNIHIGDSEIRKSDKVQYVTPNIEIYPIDGIDRMVIGYEDAEIGIMQKPNNFARDTSHSLASTTDSLARLGPIDDDT